MFIPQDNERQKITELKISSGYDTCFSITDDVFHNKKLYGRIEKPHDKFEISISGCADTGLNVFEEFISTESYPYCPFSTTVFGVQTRLTMPGINIWKLHKSLCLNEITEPYDKTMKIMKAVAEVLKYDAGTTGVHEAAENALSLKSGVCQDFAHIMISLLRMANIPARYVVGMMLGEGASHAWVEAFCRGYWYGFDPTNNKLVNDEYIKVSYGRDSSDCPVIKGNFYGNGMQTQKEEVNVEEIHAKE